MLMLVFWVGSPTFMMEYPKDPSPPTTADGSAASKSGIGAAASSVSSTCFSREGIWIKIQNHP